MKLSLCITTYNRSLLTIESFAQVINDSRIDDIVIMDDASTDLSCVHLGRTFIHNEKIRIFQQPRNVGMSINKRDAISHAKNEWVIIFDSDNIIDPTYLDAFYDYALAGGKMSTEFSRILDIEKFIFCPDFAKPKFDYREFNTGGDKKHNYRSGIYGKRECAIEIAGDNFNCLMNTCNYIVNRDFYLQTYTHNPKHKASDTIWHNYNHLKSDGVFCMVPGMQYYHRVHADSGFLKSAGLNMMNANEVRRLIQQL